MKTCITFTTAVDKKCELLYLTAKRTLIGPLKRPQLFYWHLQLLYSCKLLFFDLAMITPLSLSVLSWVFTDTVWVFEAGLCYWGIWTYCCCTNTLQIRGAMPLQVWRLFFTSVNGPQSFLCLPWICKNKTDPLYSSGFLWI